MQFLCHVVELFVGRLGTLLDFEAENVFFLALIDDFVQVFARLGKAFFFLHEGPLDGRHYMSNLVNAGRAARRGSNSALLVTRPL